MNTAIPASPRGGFNSRQLWAAVTVLGIAVVALGASLIYVQTRPVDGHTVAALDSMAMDELEAPTGGATADPLAVSTVAPGETVLAPAPASPAAVAGKPATVQKAKSAAPSVAKAQTATLPSPGATVAAPAVPPAVVIGTVPDAPMVLTDAGLMASRPIAPTPRAICASCGRVESVTPIERKGDANGVGAVAGGVLGAVVGNQIGKGNGRALATIVGAVGGGVAGNAIEKNVSKTTVYQVQVRMEDGSLRSVEQASAPVVGAAVIVEGASMRPADGSPPAHNSGAAPTEPVPQAKVYSTEGN
ncbi:MAG: glycine zipper 2TM domain-containing protein [Betaproteobacteria bacterium]